MLNVACPDCEAAVDVPGSAMVSEIVVCDECDGELEIITIAPLTVAPAPEIEEDWGE